MEPVYKYYKPAWRSFYASFFMMLLLIVIAAAVHYFKPAEIWLKWMWIAVAAVEVLALILVAIKRATVSLVLRDNPCQPADQEIAYVQCNPLKPFSSEFRKSIEIGLSNIMHIEVGQTMMQTMLNVGNLVITSSGTDKEEIRANDIPNPHAVRDEIQVHARHYTMPS